MTPQTLLNGLRPGLLEATYLERLNLLMLLSTSMHILLILLSPGSVETDFWCGGKLNIHLMASCVGNVHTKNY